MMVHLSGSSTVCSRPRWGYIGVLCVVLIGLLWVPGSAFAAAITVNSTDDNVTGGDNNCTLREAINNANADSDTSSGDCTAGNGADTITFSVNGTITLGSTLPAITDADSLVIDGGSAVTISGNETVGVLVVNANANCTVQNITIADGRTVEGGGILNNGTLTVSDSTFVHNFATSSETGGGIMNHSIMDVTGSTFKANGSAETGGGIGNRGTATVTNSTFVENYSINGFGGAISNDATLTVTHTTFSGNQGDFGAAISVLNAISTVLRHTIIANSVGRNCFAFGPNAIVDGGYNISDDETCNLSDASSQPSTDPLLDPAGLQDNGGPTETIALCTGDGTPAGCAAASPALDAIPEGENGCGDTDIIKDQRGVSRPQGATCDIGAFEVESPDADEDGDGVTDTEDQCHGSDLSPVVVIDGCNTKVPNSLNVLSMDGCTISDLVGHCAESAANRRGYLGCVSQLTQDLQDTAVISGKQKRKIHKCALKSVLRPRGAGFLQ